MEGRGGGCGGLEQRVVEQADRRGEGLVGGGGGGALPIPQHSV